MSLEILKIIELPPAKSPGLEVIIESHPRCPSKPTLEILPEQCIPKGQLRVPLSLAVLILFDDKAVRVLDSFLSQFLLDGWKALAEVIEEPGTIVVNGRELHT